MSHESTPPQPPGFPNRAIVSLLTAGRRPGAAAPPSEKPRRLTHAGERVVRGGKVLYFPAPNGTVRIVGLSESGEWVAEFACREIDFDEKSVRRMARHVATATGIRIAVVG